MSVMTKYQQKRIRRANAADIAKMVDQDRYWSAEALREISKRIDKLRLVSKMSYSLRPLTKNALRMAIESNSIRYGEAVELRLLLRPQHRAEPSHPKK